MGLHVVGVACEYGQTSAALRTADDAVPAALSLPADDEKPSDDMTVDPVCQVNIHKSAVDWKESFQGETYYFCNKNCHDLFLEKPEPLVPRSLRLTVSERVDASGAQLLARVGGPRQPAVARQLAADHVGEFQQVGDVGCGVRPLVLGERPAQPVGQPVTCSIAARASFHALSASVPCSTLVSCVVNACWI